MKLIDFIVCDDIRHEVGGKQTLVGVYSDRIVFKANTPEAKWPVSKFLGVVVRFKIDESDPPFDGFDITLDLNTHSSTKPHQLAKIEGIIKKEGTGKMLGLNFQIQLNFPEPGEMSVNVNFTKGTELVQNLKSDLAIQISERSSKKTSDISLT
jgi:hypothetical protein